MAKQQIVTSQKYCDRCGMEINNIEERQNEESAIRTITFKQDKEYGNLDKINVKIMFEHYTTTKAVGYEELYLCDRCMILLLTKTINQIIHRGK